MKAGRLDRGKEEVGTDREGQVHYDDGGGEKRRESEIEGRVEGEIGSSET